jgi:hypothetical protein
VRHSHYQEALRETNVNATTSVPTHTLGLAFDIGVVNSPLRTVYEIRDVLQQMQRAGDILFVAERRQLVFHVVPHPSRLGHFTEVYMKKVGPPSTSQFAEVVAAAPAQKPRRAAQVKPTVVAEVLAVTPASGTLEEWHATEAAAAAPIAAGPVLSQASSRAGLMLQRWGVLLLALLAATWRITTPPRVRARLLEY